MRWSNKKNASKHINVQSSHNYYENISFKVKKTLGCLSKSARLTYLDA